MKPKDLAIQINAVEQYFHVEQSTALYKADWVTLKSVDKTLVCDHSSESYRVVLSRGSVRLSSFPHLKAQLIFDNATKETLMNC